MSQATNCILLSPEVTISVPVCAHAQVNMSNRLCRQLQRSSSCFEEPSHWREMTAFQGDHTEVQKLLQCAGSWGQKLCHAV